MAPTHSGGSSTGFHTTRWSLVLAAGDDSREALSALCRLYWFPAYAFLPRSGCSTEEAEDLTQGFFARMIERGDFGRADPERGRFRSYLLTALKHYLVNQAAADRALKRRRGKVLSLDVERAEHRMPAADDRTPEDAFLRGWAMDALAQALDALERGYKGTIPFTMLRRWLAGAVPPGAQAEAAESLGVTRSAVKVALHRLRKAYGAQLRAAIAETVDDPASIDEEIGVLLAALR